MKTCLRFILLLLAVLSLASCKESEKDTALRLVKEWDGKEYTGEEIDVLVRYILYDWTGGLQDGYCIMSIDTMMHSIPRQERR